jgi:GAF domain-containing protein
MLCEVCLSLMDELALLNEELQYKTEQLAKLAAAGRFHPELRRCQAFVAQLIQECAYVRSQIEEHQLSHDRQIQRTVEALRTYHASASAERIALNAYSAALNHGLGIRSSKPPSPDWLEILLSHAMSAARADMGNIQVFDHAEGVLKIRAQRGFEQPFLEYFDRVHSGECACGEALRIGKSVIIGDVTENPVFRFSDSLEIILDAGVRAVQSTPLFSSSGTLVGVLSTHYRKPRKPSEQELSSVRCLAAALAEQIVLTQTESVPVAQKV